MTSPATTTWRGEARGQLHEMAHAYFRSGRPGAAVARRLRGCRPGADRRGERQGDQTEEQEEHFGITEVVLEESGDEQGDHRGEAARGRARAGPRRELAERQIAAGDEHEPRRERRQAAFGGELDRHVVEMRARVLGLSAGSTASGVLYFARYSFGTMFGPTPTSGWSSIMAMPDLSIATRSRLVGSAGSKVGQRALGCCAGATSTNSTMTTGTATAASSSRRCIRSAEIASSAPIQALRDS